MKVEELLAMLQEKGLDDNAIKELLKDALGTLDEDFREHDMKEEGEKSEEEVAADEKAEASKYLGVAL